MLSIGSLRDLEKYGICLLTGEADALSYRILCDLTEEGRQLICEAYGLRLEGFAENWNHGTDAEPHVACIMLAHDAWRQIGPIALVKLCHTVLDTDKGTIFGLQDGESFSHAEYKWPQTDEEWKAVGREPPECIKPAELVVDGYRHHWPEWCHGKPQRMYVFGSGPRVGTRNVHAMSGRVS